MISLSQGFDAIVPMWSGVKFKKWRNAYNIPYISWKAFIGCTEVALSLSPTYACMYNGYMGMHVHTLYMHIYSANDLPSHLRIDGIIINLYDSKTYHMT